MGVRLEQSSQSLYALLPILLFFQLPLIQPNRLLPCKADLQPAAACGASAAVDRRSNLARGMNVILESHKEFFAKKYCCGQAYLHLCHLPANACRLHGGMC